MGKSIGSVLKDSAYLGLVIGKAKLIPTHPIHFGIDMQAHHIISEKGVKLSGMGARMVKIGYNINSLPNLVLIPCTLQGACHLGVQVHRGDHRTPIQMTEPDNDAHKSPTYHIKVSDRLADLSLPAVKACKEKNFEALVKQIHELSEEILEAIQRTPGEMPLTSVAQHFKPKSSIGCGGHSSVPDLNKRPRACPKERNHFAAPKKPGQASEGITFKGRYPYVLQPGQ
jgi:hypothetical protein